MDFYNINMSAFRKRYPDLVKSLEDADLSFCKVVQAKNDTPTLKVQYEGKEVFVHSAYDPQKEARRWADEVDIHPHDLLIVFGFGLGYHIVELLNKAPSDSKIIVIEPTPSFLRHAFYHQKLDGLIAAKNVHLVLGEDIPALKRYFLKLFDLYSLDKIKTASYLPVVRTCADVFYHYQRIVFDELLAQYVNISTVLHFSFQWTKNYFSNLMETMLNPGIATLFEKLHNKPAILVSAGPSLTKNMHLLKEAKNKAFILCVGSALRVLLNNGIMPDLVISVDGGEPNYRHFQNLPDYRIPLVFDPIIHHGILEEYKGPKFVGLCNNLHFQWTSHFVEEEKGYLKIGPSVANIALDLLKKTGADPIIFVGQDLAYTSGFSHARGTTHEVKTIEDVKKENKLLEVEGIDGGKVLTDRTLYTFLKWFETYIAEHPGTTFINATEGGAKIPGTLNMTLEKAIREHCNDEINYPKMLSEIQDNYHGSININMGEAVEKLRDIKAQMLMIKNSARRGLKKSRQLTGLYKKGLPELKEVDRILKSLDKVDREIKEKQQAIQISVLLFQPFVQALRQLASQTVDDESEKEKGQRIASESVLLYTGIYRVAEVAEELMGNAIRKIESEFPDIKGDKNSCGSF